MEEENVPGEYAIIITFVSDNLEERKLFDELVVMSTAEFADFWQSYRNCLDGGQSALAIEVDNDSITVIPRTLLLRSLTSVERVGDVQ